MLKGPFRIAIALVVAFVGGVWSVLAALDATVGLSAIRIGPWEAFPLAQTRDADPYARAHRARDGKLLYASAEGLVMTAKEDLTGQPLNATCTYRISGMAPASRLWTLYARSANGADRAPDGQPTGLNSRMILHEMDGSFIITVSSQAQPGNWLAVPARGHFTLLLSLFDTPAASSSGLSDIPVPEIARLGCAHA